MSSQSIPATAQALIAYDDKSVIKEDYSHQLHLNNPTRIGIATDHVVSTNSTNQIFTSTSHLTT